MSSIITKDTIDEIYDAIDEVESVAETLVKDTVGWSGKNLGQLSESNIQTTYGQQNATEIYANNGVIVTSTGNYGRCGYQFSVQNGKMYTISMMVKKSASMGEGGILFGSTPNWDAEYGAFRDNDITTSLTKKITTITAVDDTLYVGVYPNANGVAVTVEDFMIEEGEQATTFTPYHATVDTVKADKATNATAGNFASLDASGNLADSGHKDTDYVHKTGNETIFGNKHFTGDVVVDGNIIGKKGTIYGFHIDSSESDPDACVAYLDDAVGMTPAYMDFTNGRFNYGSWADAFFMPRPCMLKFDGTVDYYLDPNDYSKKEDGSASDVDDLTYGGNAMMEWGRNGRKIWYKAMPDASDATSGTVKIANYQVDSTFHAWSFINMQGDLVDHFYTPIYKGSLDSNNRMRSISGQDYNNYVNNKTRAEEIAYAEANNPSTDKMWFTETHADRELINYLLILISKSLNSQAKFGEGRTGFSWAQSNVATTGIMDDKGLFYGETNNQGLGVKVFGMEQPWGDIWRAEAGLINDNGTYKAKYTYGTQDGSTAEGYNTDGTGYLAGSAALPSTSGAYIKKMTFNEHLGLIPTDASGSEQTYYCDGLWTNNSQVNYALRGGYLYFGRRCGMCYLSLYLAPGDRRWDFGAALSCKPLA